MTIEGEEVADWYDVQYDLLALIAEEMISFSPSDFVRLSAVCAPWRSFFIQNYEEIKLPNHLPVLLIPWPQENQDQHQLDVHDEEEDDEEEEEDNDDCAADVVVVVDDDDGVDVDVHVDDEEEDEDDDDDGVDVDVHVDDEEEEEDDDDDGEEEEEEDVDGDDEEKLKTKSSRLGNGNDEDDDDNDDADEDEEEEEGEGGKIFQWIVPRYYDPKEIFEGQDSKRHKPTRAFYSLSERKVYKDFHLAVPYFKNCVSSYKGWLITVEEDENFTVQLFNPFRSVNNTIQLPPLTTLDLGDPDECVRDSYCMVKVVLSASPSSISNPSDLVVMGFYGNHSPAFCRLGDKSWTCFLDEYIIEDAIYYKGQFYGIRTGRHGLMGFDVKSVAHHALQVKVTLIAEAPIATVGRLVRKYLVESAGDLLQVHRYIEHCSGDDDDDDDESYYTDWFRVLKFDPLEPNNKWIDIKTLEGRILFLGANNSLSVPASDLPGWKPNCIYFTDDYFEYFVVRPSSGPHDMGVFNLENGRIEPHYMTQSKTILPPPLWIQPML